MTRNRSCRVVRNFGIARARGLILPIVVLAFAPVPANAQWTQWGGPKRDFAVDAKGLADQWPEEGPKKLWGRELGDGYATILVDDGILFTMYRVGEDEFSAALDAKTGKTIWEHKHPSPTTSLMQQFGAGPHTTPIIVGDRLVTIGTNAVAHCYEKKTGNILWKHDLPAEFNAPVPGRGYGYSPIAYKNTVIVAVDRKREAPDEGEKPADGDKLAEEKKSAPTEGQSLMAFDMTSGSLVWKSSDFPMSYASAVLIHFNGEEQLVQLAEKEIFAVKPSNGELLWQLSVTPEGANLSTPVWNGKDTLFCSSAYDSGSRGIKLSKKDGKTVAEQTWFSKKMRIHHGNALRLGDYIYASSGDSGPAFFMAVKEQTGDVAWRERGFKKANAVHADGKLIILDEDGDLALATATHEGLKVHSRCKVAERYAWAAPTLVGKTLYVRDRKTIMAFDVGKETEPQKKSSS